MEFKPGDVVRVKQPEKGRPFHTRRGQSFDSECFVGAIGKLHALQEGNPYRIWSIYWDQDQKHPDGRPIRAESWIDEACIELDVDERYVFNSLGGLTPHCATCTCYEGN